MKTDRRVLAWVALAFLLLLVTLSRAYAEPDDCRKCHEKLFQKKNVHAAMEMNCRICHGRLDASTVPHKSTGQFPKGLSAEPAALCEKCHEVQMFQGKVVHGPVAAGACTRCHDPHASDYTGLLVKQPAKLCLGCHPEVQKQPHVIASFSGRGHPLGDEANWKAVGDPLRPGKPFYCVACHEPHASANPKLLRFAEKTAYCQQCHKK